MASDQSALYQPATKRLLISSSLAFLSGLIILISFSSPYWLESYPETFQSFVRMGLWEFCFDDYRHPRYQRDHKFTGCHYLFGETFLLIREWLQPAWLMFVQAMMTLAFMCSLLSLIALAIILMRYFLKYEWLFIATASALQGFTAGPIFLAICVFGARCQERSWLLNPLYNHISWAYAFAVIAFFISVAVTVLLFLETKASRERKRRSHRLVTDATPYRY